MPTRLEIRNYMQELLRVEEVPETVFPTPTPERLHKNSRPCGSMMEGVDWMSSISTWNSTNS